MLRCARRGGVLLALLAACDRSIVPAGLAPGERPSFAVGATLTITRAELAGGRLRVEGSGAAPNASMLVDGTAAGRADGGGAFRLQVDGFASPTCRITVSDGAASTQATLSGCTPTSQPASASAPAAPTPTAPAAGATAAQSVALSWSAVTAATPIIVYNWQVATTAAFTTIVAWGQNGYTETSPRARGPRRARSRSPARRPARSRRRRSTRS